MPDVLTPEQRHKNMVAIKSRNTKPEMIVRSLVHRMGYRYRLHRKDLPGTPDLVFPSRRKVIFVHGCYWHIHDCPYGRVVPKTNTEFWQTKRLKNVTRDQSAIQDLEQQGWKILLVWECEVKQKDKELLQTRIRAFLDPSS